MRSVPLILTIGLGIFFLPVRFAGQDRLAVQNIRTKSATGNFIQFRSPMIALQHVRVIDGTGAPVMPDQTMLISDGKIAAMGEEIVSEFMLPVQSS